MNPWPFLISIIVFALFQAGFYAFSIALDFLKVKSEEKLTFYRTSILVSLGVFPAFLLLKLSSWKSIEIIVPYSGRVGPAGPGSADLQYGPVWPELILFSYVAAIGLLFVSIFLNYVFTRHRLKKAEALPVDGRLVWMTDMLKTPFCFGFMHPKVYMPKEGFGKWTKVDEVASISHEYIHVRRRDPMWKVLSLVVRSLFFFSPLSYLFHRKMDIEMEIYCDSATLEETGLSFQEYGNVLLRAITNRQPGIWLATNMNESNLRRRILAMKSKSISRPVLKACACVMSLLIGVIAVAATSGVVEKKKAYMISAQIFLNGEKISSPRIVTLEDEMASISQINADGEVEMKMEVLAYGYPLHGISRGENRDGIMLDLDVFYIQDGVTTHSHPKIVTIPNEEALIKIGQGPDIYTMKVIVAPQ